MIGTDCQALWQAFRDTPRTKITPEDWPGKDWHLHAWSSCPELEQMPGHLWRAGRGRTVSPKLSDHELYIDGDPAKRPALPSKTRRKVPEELWPCNFEKPGANPLPPAETCKDTKRLDRSMFIGVPGEIAGTPNPHARLEFKWTESNDHQFVNLAFRVDLDRVLEYMMKSPEFKYPRTISRVYTVNPWTHINPYELQFEHKDRLNNDHKFVTYTLGITDHDLMLGVACKLYVRKAVDNHLMIHRLLCLLDEGLIHPTTDCTLVYHDHTERAWGMGQGMVLAEKLMADLRQTSSSDSRRSIACDFVQTLNEKGEPPNSELSLLAPFLPAAAADLSTFEHDADPAVLQASQVLVFLL